MKFYDSMGFESEHGIWARRVDAAYAIDEAQMAAVTLSSKLGNAETRIAELEAALDWALRHGAYTDPSETGFVYVSTDGHRKRLPPFPPLIPTLEAARARICSPSPDPNLSAGSAPSDATQNREGEHG